MSPAAKKVLTCSHVFKPAINGISSYKRRSDLVYCAFGNNQRLPRLRSRLLAPTLSGSGSEPGARDGAGNFGCGSGPRAQSRSQAS
ncbi:unnamed protein product [Bursaphelenchus xylophilus]|uniref:(pine wood nematode) hypothetical protein n=1 Tax=Bursaphelenchus xylophilus TaxID=6326 RepID=A0A1I7S7M8_BURXY|nr:unnamed protein product [Bursaphelenchus xylophilus]CAG9112008.1 unnamed protein product [Bursaphelenchus xylophilus]